MAAPTLIGERVVLRAPVASDADARRVHGYVSDIERGYGEIVADGPMTDEQAAGFLTHLAGLPPSTTWVVEHQERAIGVAFLHHRSERDRQARYAVGLFDPSVLGRGLGRDITRAVLAHAFDDLGLHRVDLRVLADNHRAIRCYESCGFRVEGRLRDSCLVGDEWVDDLVMAVLEDDWRAAGAGHG